VAAFEKAGWTASTQSVAGGRSPNPTRVDLARPRRQLRLLAYAWRITHEGKGRTGNDYRIQTTRSHGGDFLFERDRTTLGFGVDAERGVIAVFDGWTKRTTGRSSSVHIDRAVLDGAREHGFAVQAPTWDSRIAVRTDEIDHVLGWLETHSKTRLVAVQPRTHAVDGEHATLEADLRNSPAAYLRVGDRLVMADTAGPRLLDPSVWTVTQIAVEAKPSSRNQSRSATFACRRFGRATGNGSDLLSQLPKRSAS
jgi:hypothetical protein